jgi:hypothetical protein
LEVCLTRYALVALLLVAVAAAAWVLRRGGSDADPGSAPRTHERAEGDAALEGSAGGAPALAGAGGARATAPVGGEPGLRGLVLDAKTSAPVPGAQVEAFALAPQGTRLTTRARQDGTFELQADDLPRVPGGRALRLVVSHPGFAPATIERLAASPTPVEVRLEPAGWIVGEVVFEGGTTPPEGLRVDAQRRATFGTDIAASHLRRRLAQVLPPEVRRAARANVEDGRFRLGPLAAGVYAVGLVATGLPVLEIAGARSYDPESGATVVAGETLDLGRILVAGSDDAVVRVLDGAAESPLTTAAFHGEREMDLATELVPLAVQPVEPRGSYRVPSWHRSDAAGGAESDLGDLVVSAPGYGAVSSAYVNHFDDQPLVVRLYRSGGVRGRVLTLRGAPADGAIVLVTTGVDESPCAAVTIDASGAYLVEGLPALRELRLRVLSAAGPELYVAGLTLQPGEVRELHLGQAGAGLLAGSIRLEGGPLPNVIVSLDTPDDQRLQVVSGEGGAYAFAALQPGRHVAFYALPGGGYAERTFDVVAGQAPRADVELGVRLPGTVRVETLRGEPADRARLGVHVEVVARSQGDGESWRLGTRLAEANDGRFTLLLPVLPGSRTWSLAVEEDDAHTLVPVEVVVPRAADAPPVVVPATLDPKDARIRLALVDDATGAPIPGAGFRAAYRTTSEAGSLPESGVLEECNAGFGAYVYVLNAPHHVSQVVRFEISASVREVTQEVRLVRSTGVRIAEVTGPGAATAAGLKVGDLITRYGGEPVPDVEAFRARLQAVQGASTLIDVEGLRGGVPLRVTVRAGRLGVRLENAR